MVKGDDHFYGYILPVDANFYKSTYVYKPAHTSFMLMKSLHWSIINNWRDVVMSTGKPNEQVTIISDSYTEKIDVCQLDIAAITCTMSFAWKKYHQDWRCGGIKCNKADYPGCPMCRLMRNHWSAPHRLFLSQSAVTTASVSGILLYILNYYNYKYN